MSFEIHEEKSRKPQLIFIEDMSCLLLGLYNGRLFKIVDAVRPVKIHYLAGGSGIVDLPWGTQVEVVDAVLTYKRR